MLSKAPPQLTIEPTVIYLTKELDNEVIRLELLNTEWQEAKAAPEIQKQYETAGREAISNIIKLFNQLAATAIAFSDDKKLLLLAEENLIKHFEETLEPLKNRITKEKLENIFTSLINVTKATNNVAAMKTYTADLNSILGPMTDAKQINHANPTTTLENPAINLIKLPISTITEQITWLETLDASYTKEEQSQPEYGNQKLTILDAIASAFQELTKINGNEARSMYFKLERLDVKEHLKRFGINYMLHDAKDSPRTGFFTQPIAESIATDTTIHKLATNFST